MGKPYYLDFDERYKFVYASGVEHYTSTAKRLNDIKMILDWFLDRIKAAAGMSVIEFGCGEGYLAEWLLDLGLTYEGIDISASAIRKAEHRLQRYPSGWKVGQGNMIDLSLAQDRYDMSIDVASLHMLICDDHRSRYLSNVHTCLRPGGHALFAKQSHAHDAKDEQVHDYDEYIKSHGIDIHRKIRKPIKKGDQEVTMDLDPVVSRNRSRPQYEAELKSAGFTVLDHVLTSGGRSVSIIARKQDEIPEGNAVGEP